MHLDRHEMRVSGACLRLRRLRLRRHAVILILCCSLGLLFGHSGCVVSCLVSAFFVVVFLFVFCFVFCLRLSRFLHFKTRNYVFFGTRRDSSSFM